MSVETVNFEIVKSLKNEKNWLIIDVRELSELKETGEIPGSINISLNNLDAVLKSMPAEKFKEKYGREKPSLESPIIFSCRSGRRSLTAYNIAKELGYKNLKNYSGGWLNWEKNL